MLQSHKNGASEETKQVLEMLQKQFRMIQSSAAAFVEHSSSPGKSPKKSPSKIKENEEPLQEC